MEHERWLEIERIYHAALQSEGLQRASFLEKACGPDRDLRNEVESLLKYAQSPPGFLEEPALEVAAKALVGNFDTPSPIPDSAWVDARIAQFRIIGKLGTGGMGEVFRAVRADDQYEKQVAIKLVRQGMSTEFVLARFRQERQILASFEHENIARMLDGGTTEGGHPYFVMELVEGKPIDEFCDERRLAAAARLDLFRSVCSAVQYAHQRLVVHRDIKPSNILVTAEGVPKLLDFGIATILSPEPNFRGNTPTLTGQRVMTPQFASPEQLRGETITTAADVYSLGVVLYTLLTGRSPYRLFGDSPYALAQAVCEGEPERPSAVVRDSNRLGNSNPAAEEATPEGISGCRSTTPEKLRRTLSGDLDHILLKALRKEPQRRYASARELSEDLRFYSLGLPVSARSDSLRYRCVKFLKRNKFFLAVAAIFALLAVSGGIAIVREARIARTQQARAERRFNDVRKLANSLLFDIHDRIQDLPGSTGARKALVDDALQYLDSLAREVGDVPDLQRELAGAYERVGDVQGNPYFANLGDTAGAVTSYRKALGLRQVLASDRRASYDDQAALAAGYEKLGIALTATSDFSAALEALQNAYRIFAQLALARPVDPQAQESLAGASFAIALCRGDTGDTVGSLEYYRKSAVIRERITGGPPAFQVSVQTRLAGVYAYMAGIVHLQGDLDSALLLQEKARGILDRLLKSDPQNARLRQYLLENEYWVGFYFAAKGLPSRALPHYQVALSGYRELTVADPHDVLAGRYLAKCYRSIGSALTAKGEFAQGIEAGQQSVRIFERLSTADHADTYIKPTELANARSALAESYSQLAQRHGSSRASKIANWRASRLWFQRSLDTWMEMKRQAMAGQFDGTQPDKLTAEIAACDAALARLNARSP